MALKGHIVTFRPMAILIQDVPIMNREEFYANCNHIAQGYRVFTSEQEPESNKKKIRPENIILVHGDIQAEKLVISDPLNPQNTKFRSTVLGIKLTLPSGRKIPLYSVYIRPPTTYNDAKMILDSIRVSARTVDNSSTVVMGDFNSHSLDWAPALVKSQDFELESQRIRSARGRAVSRFMNMAKLICLNKIELGPTHVHVNGKGSSYVDLAFVGLKSCYLWNTLELVPLEGGTSHRILVAKRSPRASQQFEFIHDTNRIEQYHFIPILNHLHPICLNWRDLSFREVQKRMDYLADRLYLRMNDLQNVTKFKKSVSDQRFSGYTERMRKLLKKLDYWRQEAVKLAKMSTKSKRTVWDRLKLNSSIIKRNRRRNSWSID